MCSVKCAVFSVLPATGEYLAVEIIFITYFTFKRVLELNKGHFPSADLRYGEEDSISPSTLLFAVIKG